MRSKLPSIIAAVAVLAMGARDFTRAQSLVEAPAPPCIWKVTYEYNKEPAPAPKTKDPRDLKTFERMQALNPRPKVKTVFLTAETRREVTEWANGRTTESWQVGDLLLYTALNLPDGQISYTTIHRTVELPNGQNSSQVAPGFESSTFNFPELSWLKPEFLAGVVPIKGGSANHFVNPPPPKNPPGEKAAGADKVVGTPVPKQEAWIDSKTGFPIAMQDESVRVAYKLLKDKPSVADMKMPAAYEALWKRLQGSGVQ